MRAQNKPHLMDPINKTFAGLILSALPVFFTVSAGHAQTCNGSANSNNINVGAGQVLCVSTNITQASVNIAAGGTLKIESGYSLSIQNFNNFSGTLINNGVLTTSNINFSNGGKLTNNAQATINGNLNFNGAATVTNSQNATLTFNATFTLGNASVINNLGTLTANGDVSANSGTTINNSGRFEVRNGNFNPSGTLVNNGFFKVDNFINLNGGSVENYCRFVAGNGFNNSAVFLNAGLVWVTNATSGTIQLNSGLWTNTTKGIVRVKDFSNNATVTGSGTFYVTGNSRQQGSFSGSYNHPDSAIRFYDASLSAPEVNGSYFDFGIQGVNVARPSSVIPADTNNFYNFCQAQTFVINVPLPLDLIRFDAKAANKQVALNWETANEMNTQSFSVQYSSDGLSWVTLGDVAATGNSTSNSYAFLHTGIASRVNIYRLLIKDRDGKTGYSNIKTVLLSDADDNTDISVQPNPFSNNFNITFHNQQGIKAAMISVTDLTGKQVYNAQWQTAAGFNRQDVNLGSLPSGIYFVRLKNAADHRVLSNKKLIKH